MEHSSILVDKAVSTEDLCSETRDVGLEVARLGAVFNTLVENKVEAMKNDRIKAFSIHSSPRTMQKRLQRITSSSTASSKENYDHKHRFRHHRRRKGHDLESSRSRHARRVERGRRSRVSSNSPEGSCCHLHEAHECYEHALPTASDEEAADTYDYLRGQAYLRACEHEPAPCSCPDNHNGQIKMQYDDDCVSINIDDYENVEEDAIISHDALRRARRKRHRRRKRRKKRQMQRHRPIEMPRVEKVKVIDPDDLPQRARWTIVATACLLLFLCLLLVGVTLRMAPIIDDMVRKENEELMNSLNRDSSAYNATGESTLAPP